MLDVCKRLTLTVTVGNSVTVFPKTVIVLPFRNQAAKAAQARAGQAISEELAGLLAATGTYDKVYNRNDLRDLVNPGDLRAVTGGDPAAIVTALRRRGIVEAMITGVVTSYESSSKRDVRESRKLVGFDPKTKLPLFKTVATPFTRNEGTVSVAASLIRVRNAKPIHAAAPILGRYRSEGAAGVVSEADCLRRACSSAVEAAREHFSFGFKRVTVTADVFRLARRYHEGEWEEADEFTTKDDKAFVVLKLPAECDRNMFRVTIVREDRKKDLFVQKIRWVKGFHPAHRSSDTDVIPGQIGIGFDFSPSRIASMGGGPGTYIAKFYAGREPAMSLEFDIGE